MADANPRLKWFQDRMEELTLIHGARMSEVDRVFIRAQLHIHEARKFIEEARCALEESSKRLERLRGLKGTVSGK
jgi:hypothetical protein